MILSLFIAFLTLSLVLIILGLYFTEHTELALIGFIFLFLMSLVVINGDIQVKSGESETYVYGDSYDGYHYDDYNGTVKKDVLNIFHTTKTINYTSIDDFAIAGSTFMHITGYWLAICSFIGFIAVLVGLKKGGY